MYGAGRLSGHTRLGAEANNPNNPNNPDKRNQEARLELENRCRADLLAELGDPADDIRMYVCMYVYMYVCMYECMYVCMHGYMYVCMYV